MTTDITFFAKRSLNYFYSFFTTQCLFHFTTRERDDKGNSALLHAINNKDLRKAYDYITRCEDINEKGVRGLAPLHLAASNYPELAEDLIRFGANPKIQDQAGFTALHYASSPAIVNLLVQNGLNVNDQNNNPGFAPIHTVQNLEALKALVANGANIHAKDNFNNNALHFFKSVDVTVYFLSLKVNFNHANNEGIIPLQIFCNNDFFAKYRECHPYLNLNKADISVKNQEDEEASHSPENNEDEEEAENEEMTQDPAEASDNSEDEEGAAREPSEKLRAEVEAEDKLSETSGNSEGAATFLYNANSNTEEALIKPSGETESDNYELDY